MHLSRLYMFRMSKASIIKSSICTQQVGRYNVRVIVGSSYGVDPTADPYPSDAKPEPIRSALHHTTFQVSHVHCTYRPALYILSS